MNVFRLKSCNYANQKFNGSALPLVALAFTCFAISPMAQAVVPAPDGGYPGGNTAEGQNALLSLTSGGFNTAVGFISLRSNSTGQLNTAIGAGALLANTADQNTATGAGALLSNTTGIGNTADGAVVLFSNTGGNGNTATGNSALFSNTTGSQNTAIGAGALYSNTGGGNTASGFTALEDNTTGSANVAYGVEALANNTIGNNNTAIGALALANNTNGNYNIALGVDAGGGVTTANNVICIGAGIAGLDVNNTCYIGNIFGVTSIGSAGVFVNGDGKLGTATSSQRFKQEIKPMGNASESLLALKPVSFRYKKEIDPEGKPQFGLVAEDVEKVNPDLVVRDKEGKLYSVRYDQVNAMLLNEFLKEHRKNQEQEATIARLQKQIGALTAGLQKVSAQLEVIKPAPQTALNHP